MSDTKDNSINPEQNTKAARDSQSAHFHKAVSSIFGKAAVFKLNSTGHNKEPLNLAGSKGGLITILSLIVSLGLIALFYVRAQKETNNRLEMQGKLMEAVTETKSVRAALDNMKDSLKASQQIKVELEQVKIHSAVVNRKIEEISQEKLKLETVLQEKDKNIQEKDKKIGELSNELAALAKIRTELENKLSNPEEAAGPQGESSKKSGRILVVKAKTNIVAINLGSKDGVKAGSVFDIYNPDSTYLAKLIIDEVEDTVSIGKVSPQAIIGKVKDNYIVKAK